ncbi:hypothetical protein QUF94_22795 [Peribacillus sp. NJ4]|uniref:hypothetical protein n=1 Tax=Peribacillus sp. NJ4 TaxID=3055862 RepID=UPI0025A2C95C|nr:hypothetical protein [Peribacillus sp. NJ4]MDM5214230.1 hypothetical protein [Peribacillus sp. NJ4]
MTNETQLKKVKVPFYKKWWVMLIVGFVIGGMAFGGGSSETTETSITDEGTTETTSAPAKEEPKEEKAPEAKPVKVWSNESVTISFKEFTDEGVKFLVENNSDKSVTVQAESVAINGFSTNDIMMSDAISPNSQGYATAITSELADAGEAETVSGTLNVLDTDSFETVGNASFTNVKVK